MANADCLVEHAPTEADTLRQCLAECRPIRIQTAWIADQQICQQKRWLTTSSPNYMKPNTATSVDAEFANLTNTHKYLLLSFVWPTLASKQSPSISNKVRFSFCFRLWHHHLLKMLTHLKNSKIIFLYPSATHGRCCQPPCHIVRLAFTGSGSACQPASPR